MAQKKSIGIEKISVLVSIGAVLVFSLLYLSSFFTMMEDRVYDLFLRGKREGKRFDRIIFLDVDDQAIAHVGVFPWPRSVVADGLLRLKEYNALNAIFDIEYIDKSPTQVDEVLQQGLKSDFTRSFSEISDNARSLLNAVAAGQIRGGDAAAYGEELALLIRKEQDRLYRETMGITRDNDQYLAQGMALFNRAWGTLNLQPEVPLEGEQAQRRVRAEERFSRPLNAGRGAGGGTNVDILPPIAPVMEAVRGAGFTNVAVDRDGLRRRIYLTRKVGAFWYLQLAFAPLQEYLVNPEITVEGRRLLLKGASIPDVRGSGAPPRIKDISIPLDSSEAMMLNWPKEEFAESYEHVSFAMLSYQEEYQRQIGTYTDSLSLVDRDLFPGLAVEAEEIRSLLEGAEERRRYAMEHTLDAAFDEYVSLREEAHARIGALLDGGLLEWIREQGEEAAAQFPEDREAVMEETEYAAALGGYLETVYRGFRRIHEELKERFAGKFCVIGRVDTGTTDIGVNPFHGEYVNVGTHGVVLDTILSESFIIPLSPWWSVILALVLVPLLMILTTRFKPGTRLVMGIGGFLLISGFSFGLFYFRGIFLGPLGPALAILAALVIRETLAFVNSEQEKQFIRKAFSTYLSGEVVQEIIKDPSRLQLGGTMRRLSAVFTDIRGFTGITEAIQKQHGTEEGVIRVVNLLNNYLTAMSNVIMEQKGTIDKYIGDAIVAFFGAPLDLPDHALRACRSALHMRRIEGELNREYETSGLSPGPLRTRIGINTGVMAVGNMGTLQKMNYTIMGDMVNLASRLEGVNKQYGTWILASWDTVKETGDALIYRRLDRVRVVGKREPVQLCELLDLAEDAAPGAAEKARLFHESLEIFENRDWKRAGAGFAELLGADPSDAPASLYRNRCLQFENAPPKDNWDGIFNLSEK
ncbi:MAG: CHASE2 domain-containing protein [Treponema sp.]|jgi:adenylate cyclase|nr:CHASE2 domain-containing protein [Treponema sp.]